MSWDQMTLGAQPEESTTLPPLVYTDPAVFARERDALFRRGWIAVARSEWVARAHQYVSCDIAGDPVIVVRDDAGTLHALANVCLHRACTIVRGRGAAEHGVLTCPYHRWTYELDGRLRSAPLMDRARRFDRHAERLAELRVEEWLGWVFVNQDPRATALAPELEALGTLLAPYRVEDMVVCNTLTFDSRWNWKIMVENFMESYHHLGAHPGTLNASYPAAGTHAVDLPGSFALLENPPRDADGAPFWVACIFPSTLLALTRGARPMGLWYEMNVHALDRFTLHIHVLALPEVAEDAAFIDAYSRVVNAIHLEDIPMCERVWVGVNSAFARPGRLSHLEAANWRFYRFLRERLA